MNFKEEAMFLFGSNEKAYKLIFSKLSDYKDVDGLDNLINLISSMGKNNYFVEFYDGIEVFINSKEFKYTKSPIHNSTNDFIIMAESKLESSRFPLFPSKHLINFTSMEAVLIIVELNFYFFSKGNFKSINNVNDLIFNGNLIYHLSFFVDEFKEDLSIPNYSEKFFQNLSDIKFDGKKSEQLHYDILWDYISLIMREDDISPLFNSTICICAKYLMACNALKYGRDGICCEDVVVGYTLALRLLCEDIREYVIKYYDGKMDFKIDDFEGETIESNDDVVSNDGWGFKGFLSLIFAILAFFEVIIVCVYIKEWFMPGMEFTDIPILRFGVLIIGFFIARRFYDYLTEGSDLNLFEDGRSKVMLIFIVLFIITIIIGLTMF